MITIGKPYVTIEGDTAYLNAKVGVSEDTARLYLEKTASLKNTPWLTGKDYPPAAWGEKDFSLWFSAPAKYAEYFCTERSNAFVMAVFWYAMLTGSDIRFEAPLSRRLYEGLTKKLLPALMASEGKALILDGPVTSEPLRCEGGVLSGMSCGVDSNYTLLNYNRPDAPNGARLTHLVFYDFNQLVTFSDLEHNLDSIYRERELAASRIAGKAEKIAKNHGLPLIIMHSNMDRDFYRGGRVFNAMYRYLAATLTLEHLFGTYISSSSGHGSDMIEAAIAVPTQHYEGLLCDCCQTETLHYMSSDNKTRTEKLAALADDEDTQRYLDVCYNYGRQEKNCGRCYGCMKTLIPLDIMGKLDLFEESFDLPAYYADREDVYKDLILFSRRPEASSARESVQQILRLTNEYDNDAGRQFKAVYDRLLSKV